MSSLRFEGWESVESWVRKLPELDEDSWAHLTVVDRSQRDAPEVSIGRLQRENSPGDPFSGGPDDLVQWVREQATGNSVGVARTVLRVRAWTVKGGSSAAGSRQFVVYDDGAPEAEDPWNHMSPAEAEGRATVAGLRHLGDHYKQFGETVLATFKGLAEVHSLTSQQLAGELNIQRGQALQLFRAQLADRRETSEQDALLQIHAQDARVKETAINRGIGMLEAVGKMLAQETGGPGIPAELQPVLQIVGGSPELSSALKDPKILALLRDPMAQQGLAAILADLASATDAPISDPASFEPAPPSSAPAPPPLRVVDPKGEPKAPPAVHPSLATAEPTILVAGDEPPPEQ